MPHEEPQLLCAWKVRSCITSKLREERLLQGLGGLLADLLEYDLEAHGSVHPAAGVERAHGKGLLAIGHANHSSRGAARSGVG